MKWIALNILFLWNHPEIDVYSKKVPDFSSPKHNFSRQYVRVKDVTSVIKNVEFQIGSKFRKLACLISYRDLKNKALVYGSCEELVKKLNNP